MPRTTLPHGLLLGALLLAGASAQAADAAQLAAGKLLFQKQAEPACAACHTLKDAGATGTVGPNLDELQPDREQVLAALRDGVGVMPAFAGKLSAAQIEALAAYVVSATHPK